MSLGLIESETRRFLATPDPEILCIRGKWGVGKTFAWRKHLSEARDEKRLANLSYSYVSLFGLNSLDDLRFAIFENTVESVDLLSGPDMNTFRNLLSKSSNTGRRQRPLLDLVLAAFNRKTVSDVLYRTAFLGVRNQLICFDDLERAGSALDLRDVLGLASFLKEERRCKVVMLLNDEQMSRENKREFHLQVEKVADTSIKFEISSAEAAQIAITGTSDSDIIISNRVNQLGITNIRTIKKIERLARRVLSVLSDFDETIANQAITIVVLACWSANEVDAAPPRDFLKTYNRIIRSLRENKDDSAETLKWVSALKDYPYTSTDELDMIILDCAHDGYLDEARLKETAQMLQDRARGSSRDNEFIRAWEELYHGSLSTDDDVFLDSLYRGAIENAKSISPVNINGTVRMLRECGRDEQASNLISEYVTAHQDEGFYFFNIKNHHFSMPDGIDDELAAAFASQLEALVDDRAPLDVLRSISERQQWDEQDIALMAKQTAADFERYFEKLQGNEMRRTIDLLLLIGRSGQNHSKQILSATTDALLRIAAKSPLRARRIAAFGILPKAPGTLD